MYWSRAAVPGPRAIAPVRLFFAVAARGVSFTRSHTSGTNVCACTSTTVTRRPAMVARRRVPWAKLSPPTARPAVAPATVFKKSRRFGMWSSDEKSELHLEAEPHQPSTENLRHVLPDTAWRAVGRVHVEHVAGVQEVVDVHVAAQLARPELEDSGETQVHLLEAWLEHGIWRQQFDGDIASACCGAAA